ncbi:MAG: PadR family transcriptional regulator [Candidatus Micrarchaeaceae archaeon]
MDETFSKTFVKGKRGLLRPIVISILRHGPKNGEEIMEEIESISFGLWHPSPGSLYPLLGELYKEGTISKGEDGRYSLTESGKKIIYPWEGRYYAKGHSLEGIINELNGYVSYLEDINSESAEQLKKHREEIRKIVKRLGRLAK